MWTRTYLALLVVRLYLGLQPSYIHPDENFQGPEVIAGKWPLLSLLRRASNMSCMSVVYTNSHLAAIYFLKAEHKTDRNPFRQDIFLPPSSHLGVHIRQASEKSFSAMASLRASNAGPPLDLVRAGNRPSSPTGGLLYSTDSDVFLEFRPRRLGNI